MKPAIIKQHEYISLVLNRRRMTVSYSGMKASSGIPDAVVALWDDATQFKPEALAKLGFDPTKKPDLSYSSNTLMTVIETFASKIDTIWPDWAKEEAMPKVGDTITADWGKRRGKDSGVVYEVKKNYVFADFPKHGRIGVHFDMIVKS